MIVFCIILSSLTLRILYRQILVKPLRLIFVMPFVTLLKHLVMRQVFTLINTILKVKLVKFVQNMPFGLRSILVPHIKAGMICTSSATKELFQVLDTLLMLILQHLNRVAIQRSNSPTLQLIL